MISCARLAEADVTFSDLAMHCCSKLERQMSIVKHGAPAIGLILQDVRVTRPLGNSAAGWQAGRGYTLVLASATGWAALSIAEE